MTLPDFANLTVERLRGVTGEDSHGSAVIDWSSPNALEIDGCWIGPWLGGAPGTELVAGRQTVITEQWWWGPADADVEETDRLRDVEMDVTYEVVGAVVIARDLDEGVNTHKHCPIKVVEG